MVSLRVAKLDPFSLPSSGNSGSGNNPTGGGASSGTGKSQESSITGISSAIVGLIQTQVTTAITTGVRPPWMMISVRPSNWVPSEIARIYNQFLSYTGNYRI